LIVDIWNGREVTYEVKGYTTRSKVT